MTLSSDVLQYHRRALTSAAVRAGYAHTCRYEEPAARREIARMTGVVMSVCGPGRGPNTPTMLIEALHYPLAQIAPELFADSAMGSLKVLDGGELSDDVYAEGCEDIVELLSGGVDPARRWLPTWAWMHGELVEREVFSQAVGMRKSVRYVPIPADQVFRGRCWWPCPVCQWPMHVDGEQVRCRFPLHNAAYFVRADSAKGRPMLQRRDGGVHRQPAARPFHREGPKRSMCVETAVWRHIVISGVSEIYLFERLEAFKERGVEVQLWPGKDRYDLLVRVPATGWELRIDVKDYGCAVSLADQLRRKPPAARIIVIPDYRGEAQRDELAELLPNLTVLRVSDVLKAAKTEVRKAGRR
ncbi:restriction endonuclease-related protein [Streptomyces sp. NPDC001880]